MARRETAHEDTANTVLIFCFSQLGYHLHVRVCLFSLFVHLLFCFYPK